MNAAAEIPLPLPLPLRSLLFVPGDDERKIAKALAGAADAIILDLEDAVAPSRKIHARGLCREVLVAGATGKPLLVRMNALDAEWALGDLAALAGTPLFGFMLPKCRGGEDIGLVGRYLDALETRDGLVTGVTSILPIVTESATAMLRLGTYGEAGAFPRLCGMLWGGEDLAADIGAVTNRDPDGTYAAPYQLARTLCLLAATSAAVPAIDAVFTDFRDTAGLQREADLARRAGFGGKAAIHPDQIEPINRAFTPTADEIAAARRVIDAFNANADSGVASLDGKMLDRPHYRNALRTLQRARGLDGADVRKSGAGA